jgi:hypothetical protein
MRFANALLKSVARKIAAGKPSPRRGEGLAFSEQATKSVIPAKAGIQSRLCRACCPCIPAFAGMTRLGYLSLHNFRRPNRAYHARTSSTEGRDHEAS